MEIYTILMLFGLEDVKFFFKFETKFLMIYIWCFVVFVYTKNSLNVEIIKNSQSQRFKSY